jgi:PTS system glucitol/sorbitol-specific IIB component
MNTVIKILETTGRGVGNIVGILYQSGRDTIEQVLRNILPFMAFISMLVGIVLFTGIGNLIAHTLSPLASNIFGLLLISIICAIPVLSPLLGPGAVIAQIVGTLLGVEIGLGHIPAQYSLPALFAINSQVGCDFIPVGLALGEAEPETTEIGVPAVLISRVITGPAAVVLAYIASIGLYPGH